MKKTFTINIAGYPFTIDEDAYTLLNDYLKTIEHAFAKVEDSIELINDIETRVAELLMQCTDNGSKIITLADVEGVIARVGKPEEMIEEIDSIHIDGNDETEVEIEQETTATPPPYVPKMPPQQKKLYRDPQNAMLGGVCSGLAWYLGWDVTWVRLIVVGLTILSYMTVGLIYLVLWIVVPQARTPFERMQMMGEQPTMENIGKTVTDTFKEDQGERVTPPQTNAPQAADTLAFIFSILAKALIILGLIVAIPILFALLLGLVGAIFFFLMWGTTLLFGTGLPFDSPEFEDPFITKVVFWGVVCGIGWIITLGLPLYTLVRKGINREYHLSSGSKKGMMVAWVIGFVIAAFATGMVINSVFRHDVEVANQRSEERIRRFEENEANGGFEISETTEGVVEISDSTAVAVDSAATGETASVENSGH